jgi:hemolysin III
MVRLADNPELNDAAWRPRWYRLASLRGRSLQGMAATGDAAGAIAVWDSSTQEPLRGTQWNAECSPASRCKAEEALAEERLNSVTHGVGLAASVAGAVALWYVAPPDSDLLRTLGCSIYALSLVMLYAASTLLHSVRSPELKARLRVADHVCIYLLIAGTYTPLMLSLLRGPFGWSLLACVWLLALLGICTKLRYADRLDETSPLPYVGLAWLALAAVKPLLMVLPAGGLGLLFAGGMSYSVGVLFFLRDERRYFHAIWHLFVLGGSGCHFCAIWFYVAR